MLSTDMELLEKKQRLDRILRDAGSMLVSFSGGVDSTLLAVRAREILRDRSRCVLLDSEVVPRSAVRHAQRLAHDLDLSLEIISVSQMEGAEFRRNYPDRCYHCKKITARILIRLAEEWGFDTVADGINMSDLGEHRPGIAASNEEGILHPFIEAGISKDEIRAMARDHGIPVWQKPSSACLASRIPYGDEITREKLRMIEAAEDILASSGFLQVRVRLHGRIARIEVLPDDIPAIVARRGELVPLFRNIGFSYVTLDLQGYRAGSMDEVL